MLLPTNRELVVRMNNFAFAGLSLPKVRTGRVVHDNKTPVRQRSDGMSNVGGHNGNDAGLRNLSFSVDGQCAFAMLEGGNGCGGTEQDGKLLHLRQEFFTQRVTVDPGMKQGFAVERRLLLGVFEKLSKGWAEVVFTTFEQRTNDHCAGVDEKFPPELARLFQAFGTKGLDLKAGVAQSIGGFTNGGANFVNTGFDDTALAPIQTGSAPFTNRYLPQQPLSVFTGKNAGGL